MKVNQYLKVSENKRFLLKEDGTPFFWLGDTAWELFHKLSREEVFKYLKNRAYYGFNVVQAVALAELDGIRTENYYGHKPLGKNKKGIYDPALPDIKEEEYDYWDHVDYIIKTAADLGIYVALLPTWGDKYNKKWGKGPEIFDKEKAEAYGKFLGKRYSDQKNIIWVLGGDRPLEEEKHYAVVRAMARGIEKGDDGKHLKTFHPKGQESSSHYVHKDDWLDFNMIQSGHGLQKNNHKMIKEDYDREPVKPILDGEPCYEDHPKDFDPEKGYFDDFEVRQAVYWSVFAGGFGVTYGHHSIWPMIRDPYDNPVNDNDCYYVVTWKQALERPGGEQMRYLKKLIKSRPFLKRKPDQGLLIDNYKGENHLQATRGESYAFVYTPNGKRIRVNLNKISGEEKIAHWYNPKNGEYRLIGRFETRAEKIFYPPLAGRGEDWVLIIDDAEKNYNI
ncbi:MAG: glycoside hydrolase family 140 protein [Halanaerobiaceae bacterium]